VEGTPGIAQEDHSTGKKVHPLEGYFALEKEGGHTTP
jgi:hypothetical protein